MERQKVFMGRKILLGTAALMTAAVVCWANGNGNLSEENAQLRRRVEKLEKEVEQLKKMVMQQTEPAKAVKEETKSVPPPKLDEIDLQKIAAKIQKETEKKKPARSDLDIQLYGYLKLDAAYDTSRIDNGNYAKWVQSESTNHNDDQFNMTANESRLGMRINGPQEGDMNTSGRVEVDFYGGGSENKSQIMMRHAYLKIDWPAERFNVIAGQTSDVISPLYPATLNYSVGWWAGNIGYRRPQIRLTKSLALTSDVDLTWEGALARTIGITTTPDFTPGDAGEDTGFPGVQTRASVMFPLLGYKPTTFGLSGHWASEELDLDETGNHKDFDSWSVNLDLDQPVNKWLTVKGEVFTGENLSAYLGGIGQGVNTTTYEEISSRGGWIAASLGPWSKCRFNVGTSMDDVDSSDINTGGRTLNRTVFGNLIYSLGKSTEIGLELSHWRTDYSGGGDADSLRAQTSLIYRF